MIDKPNNKLSFFTGFENVAREELYRIASKHQEAALAEMKSYLFRIVGNISVSIIENPARMASELHLKLVIDDQSKGQNEPP